MGPFPVGALELPDGDSPSPTRDFLAARDFKLILTAENLILDANLVAAELLGVAREQLVGQSFATFLCDSGVAETLGEMRKGRLVEVKSAAGTRNYLVAKTRAVGQGGTNLLLSARNIARKGKAKTVPEAHLDRFRIAFEYASVGIGMVDLDGNFFDANNPLANLFGYSKQELETMNLLDVWLPGERMEAFADFEFAARGGKSETVFERRYLNKRGEILFAEVSRGLARDDAGKPLYFVVSFRDITESKRLQGLLAERAFTDPLTGAMNRNGIEDRVGYEFSRSDRYGDKLSLVMMDLDHFKAVNDTYGHMAGDRVLRAFCDIARSCLRSTDILGRWGGEEFVALLPETGLDGAELFCERLRSTLRNFPFDRGLQIRVSIGVVARRQGEEFSALVGRADGCLYRAKRGGRDRVVVDSQDKERESPPFLRERRPAQLHWKAANRSGQSRIDAEHQESFRLANLLIDSVAQAGAAAIVPVARDLIAHMAEHFAHEEEALQTCGYPQAGEHREAHGRLLSRARELLTCLESGQGAPSELLGFLIYDLVARHFLVEDRKFFPWLKTMPAQGARGAQS